jgi:hypothetical protein
MILAIFENSGDRTYKNTKYKFDIWNGCLFPVERIHHKEIMELYPFLITHPVLTKWLYLPIETEDFEHHTESLLLAIRRKSKLFGITPKPKHRKINNSVTKQKISKQTALPQMFRDEPIQKVISNAKKISDLKNFGPITEKEFHKAGIKTVNQLVKLGWKNTIKKLVKSNSKNCHSVFTYAIIGALKNIEWNRISESDKIQAKKFTNTLRKPKKSK